MSNLAANATVWIMLAAIAVMLGLFLKYDRIAYRRFKALTETKDRQRHFAKWIVQAAILFGGGALLGLSILKRGDVINAMPAEFAPLAALAPSVSVQDYAGPFAIGIGLGAVAAAAAMFVVSRLMKPKKDKQPGKIHTLGDIEPLLPRNGAERIFGLLISLNAGWTEELFFRLLLPLLITLATGNVFIGFGVAIAVFGLVHLYQGAVGVLATAVIGLLLSAVYLATGNIWIAAAVHALIDINGLLVQPFLRRKLFQ